MGIDYKLSNQTFLFRYICISDYNRYKFRYIPYSEFPALLMLDFLLAVKPLEHNADVFKYFNAALKEKLEHYGVNNILLLSEGINPRNAYSDKFGLFNKEIYQSEIESIVYSNLSRDNKGYVIPSIFGEKSLNIYDPVYLISDLNRFNEFNSFNFTINGLKREQKNKEVIPIQIENYFSDKSADLLQIYDSEKWVERQSIVFDSILTYDQVKKSEIDNDSLGNREYVHDGSVVTEIYFNKTALRKSKLFYSFLSETVPKRECIYVYEIIGDRARYTNSSIENISLTGIDINRPGEIEFIKEFPKPHKKLFKSWLGGLKQDKDIKLIKNYLYKFKRYKEIELSKCFVYETKRYKKYILFKSDTEKTLRIDNEHTLIVLNTQLGGQREGNIKLDKESSIEVSFRDKYGFLSIDKRELNVIRNLKNFIDIQELNKGKRDIFNILLKSYLSDYGFEKDAVIEHIRNFDKFKDTIIENQIEGQSLMYDYSKILKEGMDIEHWNVGYAIPENYDPTDPFNPYYPWAEEQNSYSIVQESSWEKIKGDWSIDKGNATIKSDSGNGLIVTDNFYQDFKFSFNTVVDYNPEYRVGFIFNYKDILNYYKITLSSGTKPIELIQVIGGKERNVAMPMASFYMDGGSRHSINVSYIKNKLFIYIDGRLQYDLLLES